MADGHRPLTAHGRRPKARPTVPTPRHIRPHAATISMREAVASYLLARTDWKPGTIPRNRDILVKFTWFAEIHRWPGISELTNNSVRTFLAYLNTDGPKWGSNNPAAAKPLSKATKNKMGAVVRTFLRWAIAEGLADEAMIRNIKWPQAPKLTDSMIAVAGDDFSRLLAACDLRTWHGVRDYAILMLLYDTGIRRGELLAMRLGDVEAVDRAASVVSGKSGTRAVGMGIAARRAIRDYLTRARYAVPTDHDMLWITREGDPLGPRGVGKIIDRLKQAAGIEGRLYPHKLRHTFSTEFLRNGGNAYALQIALGHTSPIVTSNYVHLVAADVEKAMQTFSPADALAKKRREGRLS